MVLIAVFLYAAFALLNTYIYEQKQAENTDVQTYRATLSGDYVCLERNDDVPLFDCVEGLITETGERYSIDFAAMSQTAPENLSLGDKISASGSVTPIEMMSADWLQAFDVEGIFMVTDKIEIIIDTQINSN